MERKERRLWLYPLRAVAIAAAFMLMRTLTAWRIHALGYDDPSGMNMPAQVPYILVLVANIFIFNSIFYLFSLYDHTTAKRYKATLSERRVRFLPEIKRIASSYEFIVETALVGAIITAVSLTGFFPEGVRCFFGEASYDTTARTLMPLATFLPTTLLTSLFARYEARRYWCHLINVNGFEKLDRKLPLILRALLILILYPLVFPYAPFVVYMFVTVFAVLAKVAKVLTVIGVILAVCLIFFLTIGVSRLRFDSHKKKFISRLREITAEKENRSITVHEKKQARELDYDLSFTEGDQRYDVKIVYARRRVPLFFISESEAFFRYRIGTKEHHITLEKHFNYTVPTEGERVLVIISFPKQVFVASDGGSRRMVGGDKIWNTTVYDAPTFLGSADRSCLERHGGVYH